MDDQTRFDLSDGMELAGVGVREVWWRYVGLGGRADLNLLAKRVAGTAECSSGEHNLIAEALNEIFFDRGMKTFPVGYHDLFRALPASHVSQPTSEVPDSGYGARRRAAEARRRSAEAARQAAELHLAAAKLMHASGNLQLAKRAHARALIAFIRSRQAEARSS